MLKPTLDPNTLSTISDEALLTKISRRSEIALDELYGRHAQMLRVMIDGLVHQGAEADDVLQEIFLQIWKEADKYSPKAGKAVNWMMTIARRRAIDRLRRRQAYFRAQERYRDMLERQPARPHRGTEKIFMLSDLRQFLKKRMRNLPRSQREVIELAFFGGLSHREIAATTRTPLGTVKTRLELGLRKLTQAIRPLRNKI
jgi:RNA polymerase sigma-70 factor (ECF subfamily)